MKSLDPKALEAASRAFRRMHNSVCYPSASENEADWAASEIVSAYLAALDATSNTPLSDRSSLRKGAEVVGEIVMFAGVGKEVSWRKGKMPPVGTKLCAHPPLTKEEGE